MSQVQHLTGGEDGLKFYRIIISNSYKYLKQDGFLALEIGFDQKQDVVNLIESTNKYKNIKCKCDLFGNDRVIICQKGE